MNPEYPPLPVRARWDGAAFHPLGTFSLAQCAILQPGETVNLDICRARSGRSHRHAFHELDQAWENLPEHYADLPWARSPDTLRKHLLIVTGHCDCRTITTTSPLEARHVASILSQLATEAHGYCICDVRGGTVTLWTPQSMSYRKMDHTSFQAVKDDLLSAAAHLLDTTADALMA